MLKSKLFYVILLLLIALFLVWQMTAFKAKEPNYYVLKKDGDIQVREYPALIVAQVEVSGERADAISAGFRLLAGYIFGKNNGGEKIEMTAPVIQTGLKIPMTAPVLQEKKNNQWMIRFIMPNKFTLQTLPKPDNKSIALIALPAKKYIVIRFSGMSTQSNLDHHQKKLMTYILNHHLNASGDPIYAFYNPPWILPFLRRTEIMMVLQ